MSINTQPQVTEDVISAAVRGSIVIPAHNEALVIERCLEALFSGVEHGVLDVVVVANGCTDDTAEQVRRHAAATSHGVRVIELGPASKAQALRAAAQLSLRAPIIYVDADVVLPGAVALELLALLAVDEPRVAWAHMDVDTAAASPVVRGYYRTWTKLPYVQDSAVGSGVFAVNAAGAQRVGVLPDVINDDGYVRRCFSAEETLAAQGSFRITAPRSTSALVARRARIANGNAQLDRELGDDEAGTSIATLRAVVQRGDAGRRDVACFLGVTVAARALGRVRTLRGRAATWSQDRSSREQSA